MSSRIDFDDDPNAPKVNSLAPSVAVVVTNDDGDILMIRRSDDGKWVIPGGDIGLGETIPDAAMKRTLEQTGHWSQITGIVGTYSDFRRITLYTSTGEVRREFSIVLQAYVNGEATPADESGDVRWIDFGDLDDYDVDPRMLTWIGQAHLLSRFREEKPHIG
ncbi:NUDIX domain-containing protein [Nonomuraea sp. B12E4]|uniref:NUDIX hydrolase n=1 Tax=Nonomuraea sp. B12E4 TaxID=3153564 RepID=UPI00325C6935